MPLQVATQLLSVKVSSGSVTSTTGFTLTVVPPPLVITTTALSDATLGVSYNAFLDVSGGSGPVTWSLASGALPAGLSLMTSGVILGNPTALGDATFRVRAERGPLSAERGYTLRVLPPTLRIRHGAPQREGRGALHLQLQAAGAGRQRLVDRQRRAAPRRTLAVTCRSRGRYTDSGRYHVRRHRGAQRDAAGHRRAVTHRRPGRLSLVRARDDAGQRLRPPARAARARWDGDVAVRRDAAQRDLRRGGGGPGGHQHHQRPGCLAHLSDVGDLSLRLHHPSRDERGGRGEAVGLAGRLQVFEGVPADIDWSRPQLVQR
ncbi:MAG: hypothetical protein IPF87_19455 [Gemmatimonadetes bacterium]|nr:hypothetical protein [Gemmatimonadota bacterium]